MLFKYVAVNNASETIRGELDADTELEVLRTLSGKGLIAIDIEAVTETKALFSFRKPLADKQRLLALQELAVLLESGVSIADAIESQTEAELHPELLEAFQSVSRSLRKGLSFSEAVSDSGLKLPTYFEQLISAGEASGELASALRRGVDRMSYDVKLKADLRNALIYPIILMCSGIGAISLIFIFVVPKFSGLLSDAEDLPFLAQAVLGTGMWLNHNLELFLAGVVALLVGLGMVFRRPAARNAFMLSLSRLPGFRTWFAESDTASWAGIMSALLASKVELTEALSLARKTVRVEERRQRLDRVAVKIKEGKKMSEALAEERALTTSSYNLIRVGEASGKIPQMLESISQLYARASRDRMQKLLVIIEPVSILGIGGVIGVIIMGIILAITSVNDVAL